MHVFFWVTKLGASEPGVMTVSSLGDPKSLADGSWSNCRQTLHTFTKIKRYHPKATRGAYSAPVVGGYDCRGMPLNFHDT